MQYSSDIQEEDWAEKMVSALLPFSTEVTYQTGEVIMSPEIGTEAFYYVLSGTVEVSYTGQRDTRITVALIGASEFFGEIGFFDGESRIRSIHASGETHIAVFDRDSMAQLRVRDPSLFIDFLLHLTTKICSKFRRIAGDQEPVISYAQSLSGKRSKTFTETKPLPPSLIHSESWQPISIEMERYRTELFEVSHQIQRLESEGGADDQLEEQCHSLLEDLNGSIQEMHDIMKGTGYEEVMWGYVFKEIFPYFMRSRFAERAYFKPKGYAGDFLMMEHIYAKIPKGEGRLGEIIDAFCLERPGSLAIHGRRKLLKKMLKEKTEPFASKGKKRRIMNLACGPNRELFDFLQECQWTEYIEALCVDIDPDALQYTHTHVDTFPHRATVKLMNENVIKWSLGRVSHQIGKMDIIYSAGLCDYLDDKLFQALIRQCFQSLNIGGTLLLGNFTTYPDYLFLDKLLKWELLYRDADDLLALFEQTPFGDNVEIIAEEENVNLFAMATKT